MFPVTRRRFTAYVIFQGAEHRRAWRIFTRRGWRHCMVVLPIHYPEQSLGADVFSLVINPLTWGVETDVFFEHPKRLVAEALAEGATAVVKIRIDRRFDRDYVPRGLLTCVSLIKAILGLSAWYVWTPEHLARHLLRNGGELVRESDVSTVRQKAQTRRRNAARAA